MWQLVRVLKTGWRSCVNIWTWGRSLATADSSIKSSHHSWKIIEIAQLSPLIFDVVILCSCCEVLVILHFSLLVPARVASRMIGCYQTQTIFHCSAITEVTCQLEILYFIPPPEIWLPNTAMYTTSTLIGPQNRSINMQIINQAHWRKAISSRKNM